ncbi:hypothetical protein [Mycolicibacterium goodii]|jgi:hypothetical protein|uniref:SRPBCC family protein n=1 Tax=Mycolicibacterium goodii TaxID=134601 RepID=A0ABS6HT80_MYCGD|nr:hypothetical protein [Mycolicibacterium goodii]OKH74623.1 hypothetical protein EB74_05175 [Mycobacterium sp. SWH-M5]MBU8819032.1 hypothetical protein [Mycolicibacterium goodii]MBU8825780.1 hypothetical protein [Mycolicibacterium goodii]MBU8829809.1 hypothetical protein [Mycolicibacterium goodii]MBU8840834.1 hypothetical protein [Mycolicibacterium goodii]
MNANVRDDLVLSHAKFTAEVKADFDHVDIAQWLKTLPTHEYQRCAPPDHKAAGYTVDDDGTPMSVNVEMIGTGLVVQQYRFEVAQPHYCKMVSLSDVLTPAGWTTTQVIWELLMERIDDERCRYTNTVTSHPTEDFLKFIAAQGQTFAEAAAARQEASGRHCERETPLYAQSIARWAAEHATSAHT